MSTAVDVVANDEDTMVKTEDKMSRPNFRSIEVLGTKSYRDDPSLHVPSHANGSDDLIQRSIIGLIDVGVWRSTRGERRVIHPYWLPCS